MKFTVREKFTDIDKLEKLNKKSVNIFDLKDHKTLTKVGVSKFLKEGDSPNHVPFAKNHIEDIPNDD